MTELLIRGADALREGHFVLSSGLHSPTFLQKNLVFMEAARCERLCKALAEKIVAAVGEVDVAISPAVGGIIPAKDYRMLEQAGVKAIFGPGTRIEDSARTVLAEIRKALAK